jgi:hypothetical protein
MRLRGPAGISPGTWSMEAAFALVGAGLASAPFLAQPTCCILCPRALYPCLRLVPPRPPLLPSNICCLWSVSFEFMTYPRVRVRSSHLHLSLVHRLLCLSSSSRSSGAPAVATVLKGPRSRILNLQSSRKYRRPKNPSRKEFIGFEEVCASTRRSGDASHQRLFKDI